ncbi:hypothetical protein V6N13_148191 [Hibiscus sabdariffa]
MHKSDMGNVVSPNTKNPSGSKSSNGAVTNLWRWVFGSGEGSEWIGAEERSCRVMEARFFPIKKGSRSLNDEDGSGCGRDDMVVKRDGDGGLVCRLQCGMGVCRNGAAAACSFIKNSSLVRARLAIRWTHMVSNKLVTDGGRRFLEDVQ